MKTFFGLGILLAYLASIGVCFYGYFNNIYLIATTFHSAGMFELLVRIVGIFAAPLGIIMGFIS